MPRRIQGYLLSEPKTRDLNSPARIEQKLRLECLGFDPLKLCLNHLLKKVRQRKLWLYLEVEAQEIPFLCVVF